MSITAIQSGFGANSSVVQGSLTGGQGQAGYGGGTLTTTPYYGYSQLPWPQTTSGTSITIEPDVGLRKVENGWILKMHGKEYVLTETAQVAKYLQLFEEAK